VSGVVCGISDIEADCYFEYLSENSDFAYRVTVDGKKGLTLKKNQIMSILTHIPLMSNLVFVICLAYFIINAIMFLVFSLNPQLKAKKYF